MRETGMDPAFYEPEAKPVERDTETGDLFAQPIDAPESPDADLERDQERLKTLAGELALKAGWHGVAVSDLRIAAVNRGVLTGEESGARMKRLNLGAVIAAAGLVASDRFRRSDVPRAHNNLNRVWTVREFAPVHPVDAEQKAGAA